MKQSNNEVLERILEEQRLTNKILFKLLYHFEGNGVSDLKKSSPQFEVAPGFWPWKEEGK